MSITEGPTEKCECGQSFHFSENLAAHKQACDVFVNLPKLKEENRELRNEIVLLKAALERKETLARISNESAAKAHEALDKTTRAWAEAADERDRNKVEIERLKEAGTWSENAKLRAQVEFLRNSVECLTPLVVANKELRAELDSTNLHIEKYRAIEQAVRRAIEKIEPCEYEAEGIMEAFRILTAAVKPPLHAPYKAMDPDLDEQT